MAVYKATYCYPFLNSFDGRVTATSEDSTPSQNLKCKIESSNKLITGYTIEIYDITSEEWRRQVKVDRHDEMSATGRGDEEKENILREQAGE